MWGEGVFLRENPLPSKDFQEINQVQGFSPDLAGCNRKCFNSTWMVNFQMFKLDFEKAEEPKTKWPTFVGSQKKQESSRKTSTYALLTMPKPLAVWITTNWKILKEMGIPAHLTCLLRNLYAGQEATVRTGHGTTDWFQIRKRVPQGCILSPCLFNLYAV